MAAGALGEEMAVFVMVTIISGTVVMGGKMHKEAIRRIIPKRLGVEERMSVPFGSVAGLGGKLCYTKQVGC